MTPLEQLRAARALITPVEQWTKDWLARDADGAFADPTEDDAVCWCAVGALCRVTNSSFVDDSSEAVVALAQAAGSRTVAEVNDQCGHEAVLALFDRAIASLETPAGAPKGAT